MRRPIILVPALLVLAGCLGSGFGNKVVTQLGISPFWFRSTAPKTTRLAGGAVKVRGPEGYCIDPHLRDKLTTDRVAVLGSCASLANSTKLEGPKAPAILSISVSSPGLQSGISAEALSTYLASASGQAALTGGGSMPDVSDVEFVEGMALVHATGGTRPRGMAKGHWRGVFALGNRLVSIAVYSPSGRPLDKATGKAKAIAFARAIRAANGAAIPVSQKPSKG